MGMLSKWRPWLLWGCGGRGGHVHYRDAEEEEVCSLWGCDGRRRRVYFGDAEEVEAMFIMGMWRKKKRTYSL